MYNYIYIQIMDYSKNVFEKTYMDLQTFVFSNGVIIAAAGFTIGVATKEAITKMLEIVIMPVFVWLRSFTTIQSIIGYPALLIFLELFWTILIWMVTIFWCFVLLEYFLNKTIFGLATTMTDDKKKDFVLSKVEAKTSSLLSSSDEDLKKNKEEVNKIVQITTEENVSSSSNKIAKIVQTKIDKNELFTQKMYHLLN